MHFFCQIKPWMIKVNDRRLQYVLILKSGSTKCELQGGEGGGAMNDFPRFYIELSINLSRDIVEC